MTTKFKITRKFANITLGIGTLTDNRTSFRVDDRALDYFERETTAFLTNFRRVAARLMRSVGHYGKYSISEDLDSGVIVERISN